MGSQLGYSGSDNGVGNVKNYIEHSKSPGQDGEVTISAPSAEETREIQDEDQKWADFKSHFSSDDDVQKYLLSIGDKGIEALPEEIRSRAKMLLDDSKQNTKDYLAYQGYGNMPWLAPAGTGMLSAMSLGLSDQLLKIADPNKAEQYQIADKIYPGAAAAGSLAGWLMPGSASSLAAEGVSKVLSPLVRPVGEILGNGVKSVLGETAPRAASVLGRVLPDVVEGGISGYGTGALEGGVSSAIQGNDLQEVLKDANESGLRAGAQNMAAKGLSSAFKAFFDSRNAKLPDVSFPENEVDYRKLLKQSTCSSEDFYNYLNNLNSDYADTYVKTGKWPTDVQIPKSPDVLNKDGSIDWSQTPNGGYALDSNGNAIKEEFIPEIGEIIDRYGPNSGCFTSPIRNNKPYNYDQRSLPYLENPLQYHQYKVTGDLSNIEQYFENSTNSDLKQAISAYMKKYRLSFSTLKTYRGKIASAFGSIGGGEQYELPLPVGMLEGLGLLSVN